MNECSLSLCHALPGLELCPRFSLCRTSVDVPALHFSLSLSPCFSLSLSLSLPLSLSHCHSPSVPTITRTDFLSPLPLSLSLSCILDQLIARLPLPRRCAGSFLLAFPSAPVPFPFIVIALTHSDSLGEPRSRLQEH